jgi:iron complex transport system substrate-binding protein
MSVRTRAGLVLAAASLLAATACGNGADAERTADDTTATAATAPPATTAHDSTADDSTTPAAATGFPVTVTDDTGPVTIAAAPQRIVSLSASLTEIVYAVGAGDQVAAVDRYSTHPAEAPISDLSGFRPNVEAIAAHQPDLVLVARDRDGIVDALTAAGIPTLLLGAAGSLDDTYRAIEVVGAVTGHHADAADAVADLRARIDEVVATAPERERPVRYYYELSGDLHSVTSDTYIGELLGLAGLESVADAAPDAAGGYPQLNAEFVLGADPDVIFLARTDGADPDGAEVAARPGWSQLSAVDAGRIVVLDPDLASRWGPRVVELLEQVIAATAEIG